MMAELALLFRSRSVRGLLSTSHVVEILRPLPLEPVPEAPPFVRGLSMIRGKPVPVADLGDMIGAEGESNPTRLISLKHGVALAVEEIFGIERVESIQEMPPLLRNARPDVLQALAVLDGRLLLVLQASRLEARA